MFKEISAQFFLFLAAVWSFFFFIQLTHFDSILLLTSRLVCLFSSLNFSCIFYILQL